MHLIRALKSWREGVSSHSVGSDSLSDTSFMSELTSPKPEARIITLPPSRNSIVHSIKSSIDQELQEDRPFSTYGQDHRLKVVIVGCGFAGLSAAIACARQGFAVTIIERGTGLSPHGDAIALGSNAGKLLYRWGVGDQMWSKSAKGGWWMIKGKDGKVLAEEDLRGYPEEFDAPMLQGHRAQFLGVLGIEARLLGVEILYEEEVVKYLDSPDLPRLVTASGEVMQADVLIVADGVNSKARELLTQQTGKAGPTKCPSGYSIHRGSSDSAAALKDKRCAHLVDGNTRTWIGKDCHAMIYNIDNGAKVAFALTRRDSLGDATLNTGWRDRKPIKDVLEYLEDWDPALVALISHFTSSLNWPILDETPAPEWISQGGKIVFIGDCVHAMLPTSFQGGSTSVEDAGVLALSLALAGGKSWNVPIALKVYQALRRPRVTAAAATGREQQKKWHWHSLSDTSVSLRFLGRDYYGFDAEATTLKDFEKTAKGLDCRFELDPFVCEQVAKRAGIDERNFTKNEAGMLYRRATKPVC